MKCPAPSAFGVSPLLSTDEPTVGAFEGGLGILTIRDQTTFPLKSTAKRPAFAWYTYTRLPSVTGVSDPQLFFECLVSSGMPRRSSRSHRMRPVLKSIA